MIELVLGGTRSGKSRFAEQQAVQSNKQVIYVATAQAGDSEMAVRIKQHREQRPVSWKTIEEPVKLAKVIQQSNYDNTCLLVECLTLWLSNVLFDKQGTLQTDFFNQEKKALLESLAIFSGHIILVSNEVGLGVVAMDKMTRIFVDEAGYLHQQIAALSNNVVLVTAGLPQVLK